MIRFVPVLLALLAAPAMAATPAPASPAPDSTVLHHMLTEFLDGAGRNDPAAHDRFWADDLIYTGSSGRRIGKADIMRDVRSAPPPAPTDPVTVYSAEDVRIHQYGNVAVVAFRLVATTSSQRPPVVSRFLNTGTFVKRGGEWRVVAWQATRMPEPESDPAPPDTSGAPAKR